MTFHLCGMLNYNYVVNVFIVNFKAPLVTAMCLHSSFQIWLFVMHVASHGMHEAKLQSTVVDIMSRFSNSIHMQSCRKSKKIVC